MSEKLTIWRPMAGSLSFIKQGINLSYIQALGRVTIQNQIKGMWYLHISYIWDDLFAKTKRDNVGFYN